MRLSLENKIAEEFPFMRYKTNTNKDGCIDDLYSAFGMEFSDGWFDVIRGFCLDIDKAYKEAGLPVDINILQLKEKFGSMRIYFSCGEEMSEIVSEIVDKWETISENICEICGTEGKLYTVSWWQVRCDNCEARNQAAFKEVTKFESTE